MTDAGDKERDVASDGAASDETTSGRAGSDQADAAPDAGDSADATTETSPAVDPDPDEPHLSGPTGPQVIEGDSWDTAPGPSRSRSYAGRHHLEPTPLRRWAVVGAILVALGVTVSLPYVLSGSPESVSADPAPTTTTPARTPTPTGEAMSVSSSPTPSPTATAATTARPATTSRRPATTTSAPPPPFETLTLEAEDASRSGSAEELFYPRASGGKIVRYLGKWEGRGGPGMLTFTDIVIPSAGEYRITIYYVQDEDDEVRRGTITVTGAEPITPTFRGDVRRCCRSVAVTLNLTAGSKKLTFTHVDERAPSVDRIVISKV
ncbi:MAG TPA: hypothetical protein VK028_07085 [Micromonosporaceae bacterium]|nr:hypothetical protein [Micromonosporaceae bacterium]